MNHLSLNVLSVNIFSWIRFDVIIGLADGKVGSVQLKLLF